MTNQEAFDQVKVHLSKMLKRSHNGVYCVYRHPAGMKCAIGALIPDHLYRPSLENMGAILAILENDSPYAKAWREFFSGVSDSLLHELQDVHDNQKHWDEAGFIGQERMTAIAQRFSLTP